MPQLVEIPGVGRVEFPDDMSDDQISAAIQANYGKAGPERALAQSFTDAGVEYRIAQDGPTAAGAFGREAARSVAPGLGGMMSGAATGAGLGALGANPFTVGAGALIGGIAGGFGIRMGQDAVADEIAPDSLFGTKSAGEDFSSHPYAALLGGALAQGRPAPARAFGVARNLITSEGRGLISSGLREGASPAARVALHDVIDVGAGAGVGVGMSLATDDGMAPESALLGAIFNRSWIGGRAPHGEERAPNRDTGLIVSEPQVHRGPVTRMGRPEIEAYAPPRVMPMRPGLPEPAAVIPERLPAPPAVEGLPAPSADGLQSPPVSRAGDAEAMRQRVSELETEWVNNRVRREQVVSNFKQRGESVHKGEGRKAIDLLDQRARVVEAQITSIREGGVIVTPESPPRPIVEVDNRPLGTKPGDRLPLPAPEAYRPRPSGEPTRLESGPVIELPAAPPKAIAHAAAPPEPPTVEVPSRYVPTEEEVTRWSLNTPERIAENERWHAEAGEGAQRTSTETPAEQQARWMQRLEWIKNEPQAVQDPPIAAPPEALAGKARQMAQGHKKLAEGQLAKLVESGKSSTPQADKIRSRIAKLEGQLGEVGPSKRDRVREVLDSGEYETLAEIVRSGGMKPADKSVTLLQRGRRNKARLSEASSQKLTNHAEWEDAPRASSFDATEGGQLAKGVLSKIYSQHPEARRPDEVATQLGITVPEMWARIHAEIDSVARNNGVKGNRAEIIMEQAEAERVRFEDATEKYSNGEKMEAGELNKGDTFEIDGEPVRVLSNNGDTVKLRDGDRFGVQEVDATELIPADNLKPAEQRAAPESAMDRKNADSKELFADDGGFALSQESTQDGAAIVKAREAKEAAAKAADDQQGKMDFDAPEDGGILDAMKRHQANVRESIRRDAGNTNSVVPGLNPGHAKMIYDAALSVAIKAVEAGQSVRQAVKHAIDSLRAHNLTKAQRKAVRDRIATETAAQIRFGRQRDGQMRVETAKLAQEFAAKGNTNPSKADFIRELSARFPDQAAYVQKNINELFDGMMFDRATTAKDPSEWGEWARDMRDRVKGIIDSGKESVLEKRVVNAARAIHDTLFTGIGEKMHNLADGKHTGRRSDALKNFAREVFGLKAGEDGVQRVSIDVAAEADSNRMLNPLDEMAGDLQKYFRKNGIPRADRAAFKERITEHMVDPSRDNELAKQPELKKAVDFFLKRRRERLEYMRSNKVDVGDVGPRSASRVMDPLRVMANRGEFIEQARKAYGAKWNKEIRKLRAEAAKLKARGKAGDSERYEKVMAKIGELQGRNARAAAEKYFYAIEAGERGVTSDGNDIFGSDRGDKADSVKSREFGPEADELLGKFMFRDAFDLDAYETTAAVRSVTRARMLADHSQGNEIDRVGKWKQLRTDMEAEGNGDMVPMAAQLIKSYLNLGGSDNPIAQKALEWTHAFTQLAYLSRAGISNLGEPVLIGLRTGRVSDMLKAYRATGKNLARRLRGLAPNESQILADALGIAKGGMNSLMGAARMQDAFGGRGKLGKLVSAFHVKTLLTDMTHAMHEASVEIGRAFIHAEVRIAKSGGPTARLSRKNLTELGIGKADIERMVRFTERLDKASDKVKVVLEDTADAQLYRDALTLFTRSGAVLDPTRGSRAQYANSPVGSLFYSLQSFLYEFHSKVTKRHASRVMSAMRGTMEIEGKSEALSGAERTKIGMEVMAGIAAIYSAQFGVQLIREYVFSDPERIAKDRRRTKGEVLAQRMKATASRTGMFGPYDLLFNMVTGARFQREPATVVLGPAVGGFSELFQGAVNYFNEDRNTTGTNTAERKLARTAYNLTVAPALGALSATMPGRAIPGLLIQGAYHPGTREAAVRTVAGPPKSPGKAIRRKGD